MAGYSGTPLAKKLGIKPGFRVKTKGAPTNYARLLAPLRDDVSISSRFRDSIKPGIWLPDRDQDAAYARVFVSDR